MSTNVVNLDALIPRDDFAVDETPSKATPLDRINMAHLDGHFFAGDLAKTRLPTRDSTVDASKGRRSDPIIS
jgi:phospholipase C